ncbi:nicotinamide N-methyltransferase-like [Pseudophryne corroboree]|uniref:nicotinamide N-methyltransferase-like n=1 Tax=Pseudophryne corroboree TaxID=495146 RepID=UPI0030815488
MDSCSHKYYPEDGFDSREHLETYFTMNSERAFQDDVLKFPMETLQHVFSEGHIKGDLLIDISNGAFIHHLHTANRFFKQILVLKCAEKCIMELNRWINKRTGEFDWSHIFTYIKVTDGYSDQCEPSDTMLKNAIAEILKCDFNKENLTEPKVLPPADCVITVWLLELISKDKDDYKKYFRKFVKLLKPEGHLILVGTLNTTYMTIGQDKLHMLKYDESFIRNFLSNEGFIIDHWAIQKKTSLSNLCDYEALYVLIAHREN